MLEGPIRLAAIACSLLVGLGWLLFAIAEVGAASQATATEVAGREASRSADPTPAQESAREKLNSDTREYIDDANDLLLAPFAGVTDSADNKWVRRTVPAVIALLVYGFGLGFLARFARGRA